MFENITKSDVKILKEPSFVNLSKLAIDMSDATIIGSKKINSDVHEYIKSSNKPFLEYQNKEEYIEAYSQLYDKIL